MIWLLYALLTAVFAGANAITHKKVLNDRHAMEFCTVLAVVTLFISLPLFWTIDYSGINFVALLILYLASILGAIALLLFNKAIRHMEISSSIPLMVLSPIFTSIVAFIILGEPLTKMQMLGILFLVLGSYVLELRPKHDLLDPIRIIRKSKYIHYIIGGLFIFAFTGTADRFILTRFDFDPVAYVAFINLFLAFNFLIMQHTFYSLEDIKGSIRHMGFWILFAALLTLGGRLAQISAIALAPVGVVIAIKRLSSLFATLIGGRIFHEKDILRKSLACIIMVAGASLMAI